MEPNNTYKYLSVVLAIIAIIFAVLYFTKTTAPATETLDDTADRLTDCRNDITDWQMQYGQATSTVESRAALETVLTNCKASVGTTQ